MEKSKPVGADIDDKGKRVKKGLTSEDGPLASIGKAITDPIESGAEEEEPRDDGRTPMAPGP